MSEKDVRPKKRAFEGFSQNSSISVGGWISLKMAQDTKLRPSQRRELETFLKKQGLAEVENAERYEEAYKKF